MNKSLLLDFSNTYNSKNRNCNYCLSHLKPPFIPIAPQWTIAIPERERSARPVNPILPSQIMTIWCSLAIPFANLELAPWEQGLRLTKWKDSGNVHESNIKFSGTWLAATTKVHIKSHSIQCSHKVEVFHQLSTKAKWRIFTCLRQRYWSSAYQTTVDSDIRSFITPYHACMQPQCRSPSINSWTSTCSSHSCVSGSSVVYRDFLDF